MLGWFNLARICDSRWNRSRADVLKPLAFRATSKGLRLEWAVADDVPDAVMGAVAIKP